MLTRRPSYSLASLLAELPDEDLADVCADLPDLPRALAVVDLDRVAAGLDTRVRLRAIAGGWGQNDAVSRTELRSLNRSDTANTEKPFSSHCDAVFRAQ